MTGGTSAISEAANARLMFDVYCPKKKNCIRGRVFMLSFWIRMSGRKKSFQEARKHRTTTVMVIGFRRGSTILI